MDRILGSSIFKAFADDKLKIMGLVFRRVENTVEKGENTGHQHFLLFE